jgi:hypothetical protein
MDLNPQEWHDYLAVPGVFYEYRVPAINCSNGDEGAVPPTTVTQFPVSVRTSRLLGSLTIFANPAENQIRIEWENALKQGQLEILNAMGETIISQKAEGKQSSVSLSKVPSGIYFLRFLTNDGVQVRKFVKK